MIKNIIIALLVGIVIGQSCKADSNDSITRRDLYTATALCGILANENSNPLGWKPFNEFRNKMRSGDQFIEGANHYADLLLNPAASHDHEK
jgi:hypothetical protein